MKCCLDANVFLAVLLPAPTKMEQENVEGSERVLAALGKGEVSAVTSSIVFAELRWAFAREEAGGFEIVDFTLRELYRGKLEIINVTPEIASQAATLRKKYYSRQNDFSYNDGLYLATALQTGADVLVSSDPHFGSVAEIKTMEPKDFHLLKRSPKENNGKT